MRDLFTKHGAEYYLKKFSIDISDYVDAVECAEEFEYAHTREFQKDIKKQHDEIAEKISHAENMDFKKARRIVGILVGMKTADIDYYDCDKDGKGLIPFYLEETFLLVDYDNWDSGSDPIDEIAEDVPEGEMSKEALELLDDYLKKASEKIGVSKKELLYNVAGSYHQRFLYVGRPVY